jgi:carbonic anhydrase/acetyltransferase-like protein (isoleucine patch superfamily)
VQDSCSLHVGHGKHCELGKASHIGHGAVVHGAVLMPNTLIGMKAVVMDDVLVEASAIVAACAFVKAGWVVPARSLVAGTPARVIRQLSEGELRGKIEATRKYQHLARTCRESLKQVER